MKRRLTPTLGLRRRLQDHRQSILCAAATSSPREA
jgi:hypothetical protein